MDMGKRVCQPRALVCVGSIILYPTVASLALSVDSASFSFTSEAKGEK